MNVILILSFSETPSSLSHTFISHSLGSFFVTRSKMMVDCQTKLKWGKQSYSITINQGMSSVDLKSLVEDLTGVLPNRQKLLCSKWKGPLKDSDDLASLILADKSAKNPVITLIGSAETLEEKSMDDRPRFIEDMSASEIKQMEMMQYLDQEEDDTDTVDIVVLQKNPGIERRDNRIGMHEYNRFVTGLPQHQINSLLAKRKKPNDSDKNTDESQLHDVLAMTMGAELRRAYINSLSILDNGTIVSGLDDGHVQLWSRCQMTGDLKHPGDCVDYVLKFPSSSSADPAFVSAGGGAICIWNQDGRSLMNLSSHHGTTPGSITIGRVEGIHDIKFLAACFRITRQVDANQFRLVPQNDQERRRRAEAEARETMIQNELLRVSRCIKVWFYNSSDHGAMGEATIQNDANCTIVQLAEMNGRLISADKKGCIVRYSWSSGSAITAQDESRLQITGQQCTIVLLKAIRDNILAVSIKPQDEEMEEVPSATQLQVSINRGILCSM